MPSRREVEHSEDGRWVIVDGRRWRAMDPELPEDLAGALRSALGRARSAIRRTEGEGRARERHRVQLAKEGLGERGDPWWELSVEARIDRARDRLEQISRSERPPGDGGTTAG